MPSLNELITERQRLEQDTEAAATETGEIPDDLIAAWEESDELVVNKIESWGHWLRHQLEDIGVIAAEIARLQARQKARQAEYERRRAFLQSRMELLGLDKVERPLLTVRVQDNPPAVNVPEGVKLPSKFRRVIPSKIEPDKKALLAAYKSGEKLPKGVTVTTTRSLRLA